MTSTLDKELEAFKSGDTYDVLVLDTQGSELEIIKGAEILLREVKYIMCEISVRELYKDSPLEFDIVNYLDSRNFKYAGCRINLTTGWGDGIFIRNDVIIDNKIIITKENFIYQGSRFAFGTTIRGLLVKFGFPVSKFSRQVVIDEVKKLLRN